MLENSQATDEKYEIACTAEVWLHSEVCEKAELSFDRLSEIGDAFAMPDLCPACLSSSMYIITHLYNNTSFLKKICILSSKKLIKIN